MVGVYGAQSADERSSLADAMYQREWYGRERVETDSCAAGLLHHGERDPNGYSVYRDDDSVALVHGVVTNGDALDGTVREAVLSIPETPAAVLPELEGSFLVVAASADAVAVATDKLATRPCYYTDAEGFAFASEVRAVVEAVEDPSVNPEAIADFLQYGFVWGEKTLIRQVEAVPPASVLTLERGDNEDVTVDRYYEFGADAAPEAYPERVLADFESAVENTDATVPADATVGSWLSGGLDSRLLVRTLSDVRDSFTTRTFDANPGGGANPPLAARIAALLGVENETTPFEPEAFADVIEEGVMLTDGMISWRHFHNLPYVLTELRDEVDVMYEAYGQGELFGDDFFVDVIESDAPPAEALHENYAILEERDVDAALEVSVSPRESVADAVADSSFSRHERIILDTEYRTFYPNFHFRNGFTESQVGVRIPHVTGDVLDDVFNMPDRYRQRHIPFTNGLLTLPVAPLKLALVRLADEGIEDVPYERTGLAPSMPLAAHVAAYYADRLRGDDDPMYATWYRTNDDFREFVDHWLDKAADRDVFDETVIDRKRADHLAGERNNEHFFSVVTGVEIWLQNVLGEG